MAWIKLDPITRRRFARFRHIKRGYYSFLILMVAIALSIFAPFLAESRALLVSYQGQWFFPTFQYESMATFAQMPPPGWSGGDLETEYLRLQREWQAERYFYNREAAERIARRDGLNELADLIGNGGITAILADSTKSPTGNLIGLARSGAL